MVVKFTSGSKSFGDAHFFYFMFLRVPTQHTPTDILNTDKRMTLYSSTQGGTEDANLTFLQAIMRGLALDGGLFVPNKIPTVDAVTMNKWSNISNYYELAFQVMRLYISTEEIPDTDLLQIVKEVYGPESKFRDPKVTPRLFQSDTTFTPR